jgi:hypothetical protein
MPAATTKADLSAITHKDYAKLAALIDGIAEAEAMSRDADGWSIHDVIVHRAHWIDLFLGWIADGQAGRDVHIPDRGVKWSQLKPYNLALRDRYADLSWEAARTRLADRHATLVALIDGMTEHDLYGAPMPGQARWTTGRYAEASGASHYRSAARFIRKRLGAVRAAQAQA